MQGRRTLGKQGPKPALPPETKEKQKAMASCYMVITFHDSNTWSKWSNEHQQPAKLLNINDAINEMFRICEKYFKGKMHSAVIFDVRTDKSIGAENKIYQFEKGFWQMVKPVTW